MSRFVVQEGERADFYFGRVEVRVWCYRERRRLKCKITTDHDVMYPETDSDAGVSGERVGDDCITVCGRAYTISDCGSITRIDE